MKFKPMEEVKISIKWGTYNCFQEIAGYGTDIFSAIENFIDDAKYFIAENEDDRDKFNLDKLEEHMIEIGEFIK